MGVLVHSVFRPSPPLRSSGLVDPRNYSIESRNETFVPWLIVALIPNVCVFCILFPYILINTDVFSNAIVQNYAQRESAVT